MSFKAIIPGGRWLAQIGCVAALLLLAGCHVVIHSPAAWDFDATPRSRLAARPAPWTGRVLSSAELGVSTGAVYLSDESYAEVNSRWLKSYYADFRSELSRQGVVRGDDRFDCVRFSDFYSGLAQAQFYRAAFHDRIPARALALGQIWYFRSDGRAHAIVQAMTERGLIFIEPQTGAELDLTPDERKGIYFQIF
jgi:hypothetical protein